MLFNWINLDMNMTLVYLVLLSRSFGCYLLQKKTKIKLPLGALRQTVKHTFFSHFLAWLTNKKERAIIVITGSIICLLIYMLKLGQNEKTERKVERLYSRSSLFLHPASYFKTWLYLIHMYQNSNIPMSVTYRCTCLCYITLCDYAGTEICQSSP